MPRDGSDTRTRIMDAAEALILDRGFSATTVDRVIDDAGVTKGTFFYHFDSKQVLARALVERFARFDLELYEETMKRAEAMSRDPVQQVLIFVGLYREMLASLTEPHPGCLLASYLSEADLFDDDIHAIIRDTMLSWRARFGAKLRAAMARRPPRLEVDAESLADMITVTFEGAFILSRSLKDPGAVAAQLTHYRNYLELLFGAED